MEYSRIWAELEKKWSPHFPADLVSRHTPAPHTNLRECGECGLRYFTPCVPGDGDFYERLMGAAGYEANRWEFGEVATKLRPGADVLDVGCGRGAFLQLIESSAGHVVGLDTNRSAISELRGRGIEAEAVSIAEFADRRPHSFDAVCAFQTLEHLASVRELIEPAVECLRPGGRLFLSVPNRDRAWREPYEPFDYPPHHVSRWHGAQCAVLARRYGMTLHAVEREPPGITTFRRLRSASLRRRLTPIVGPRPASLAARLYGRALIRRQRYARAMETGEPQRRGVHGHTMLAELQLGP